MLHRKLLLWVFPPVLVFTGAHFRPKAEVMFKVNSTSGLRAFTVPHSMTYGQLQATLRELGCGTSSGVTYNDQACSLALSSQMSLKPRAQNGTEDIHKKRQTSATQGLTLCFSGSHPAFLDGLGTEQSWESSETSRSVLHRSMAYMVTGYQCRLQTKCSCPTSTSDSCIMWGG